MFSRSFFRPRHVCLGFAACFVQWFLCIYSLRFSFVFRSDSVVGKFYHNDWRWNFSWNFCDDCRQAKITSKYRRFVRENCFPIDENRNSLFQKQSRKNWTVKKNRKIPDRQKRMADSRCSMVLWEKELIEYKRMKIVFQSMAPKMSTFRKNKFKRTTSPW